MTEGRYACCLLHLRQDVSAPDLLLHRSHLFLLLLLLLFH